MKAEGLTKPALNISLLAGHEFIWGKFIFSQQLGFYIYEKTPYYNAWFHRWGLYRKISKNFMAGVNLKAHLNVANFFDVRFIYTLVRRER
jgi:hypothetical protein